MSFDANLAARMDSNLAEYWGAYALAGESYYRAFSGALFFYSPIPLSLFNSVILTGRDPASMDAARRSAAGCIAERGTPVLWRISPTAASGAVAAGLERMGLEPHGRQPAMLADMTNLPSPPRVVGFRIETVEGRSGRHDWAWLACDAFELSPEVRQAMSVCEAGIPAHRYASQTRFTGYLDGKPVAVSSLVMASDLAGIYAVATLPEARNRGLGTAMTLHAMAEGRRRGARTAVLQASDMGKPVYEKIGFATAYEYDLYVQS